MALFIDSAIVSSERVTSSTASETKAAFRRSGASDRFARLAPCPEFLNKFVEELDVMALSGITTAEMVLADLGFEIELGSGVAAAQNIYRAGSVAAQNKDAA